MYQHWLYYPFPNNLAEIYDIIVYSWYLNALYKDALWIGRNFKLTSGALENFSKDVAPQDEQVLYSLAENSSKRHFINPEKNGGPLYSLNKDILGWYKSQPISPLAGCMVRKV